MMLGNGQVLFLAYGTRRLEVLSSAGFDAVCHQALGWGLDAKLRRANLRSLVNCGYEIRGINPRLANLVNERWSMIDHGDLRLVVSRVDVSFHPYILG